MKRYSCMSTQSHSIRAPTVLIPIGSIIAINNERRMASSGILLRVALETTDVSEELSASFIRVTRIGELGTTLAVTSNRTTFV
jgi:hypothetical protein